MVLSGGTSFQTVGGQAAQANQVGIGGPILLAADDEVGPQTGLPGEPGAIAEAPIDQQEGQILGVRTSRARATNCRPKEMSSVPSPVSGAELHKIGTATEPRGTERRHLTKRAAGRPKRPGGAATVMQSIAETPCRNTGGDRRWRWPRKASCCASKVSGETATQKSPSASAVKGCGPVLGSNPWAIGGQ